MNPNIIFSWRREGENKKRERNEEGGGEREFILLRKSLVLWN